MKAKLIKQGDRFVLYSENGDKIALTSENPFNKLSLKNCQAIENGYDLDELAKKESKLLPDSASTMEGLHLEIGFVRGFQKALELLGGKKYSEEDMRNAYLYAQDYDDTVEQYIQSLQQTEWDVEIEMEEILGDAGIIAYAFGEETSKPKLDSKGCLILKRIRL